MLYSNNHTIDSLTARFVRRVASDLRALGVRRGDMLLVHSSLRAMGRVPGGPETVIQGILRALGPEGVLMMPALSYARVSKWQPVFDLLKTPSNVGAIPEYFRRRPNTLRSIHPTHSVCAVGPQARDILRFHHLDHTPVGPRSPFHLLAEREGRILMIGCGLCPNTSMHGVEELVEPPYLFEPDSATFQIILPSGERSPMPLLPHNFCGWKQRYDRLADHLGPRDLRQGNVLCAWSYLIHAPAMWEKALDVLRRDPLYFVDEIL